MVSTRIQIGFMIMCARCFIYLISNNRHQYKLQATESLEKFYVLLKEEGY